MQDSEIKALKSAVKAAEKRNSTSIGYEDYGTGTKYGDVTYGGADKTKTLDTLSKLGDPSYSMKTFIGEGGITKNEKGETIILDRYNFNDAVDGSLLQYVKDAQTRGTSLYGQMRTLGRHYGSGPGEGSPIAINLGRI